MEEYVGVEQVEDDHELLDLMMQDMLNGPSIYRPTNYWTVYEKKFLPELKKLGLKDFRRRRDSVLSSFGATDLYESSIEIELIPKRLFVPGLRSIAKRINRSVSRNLSTVLNRRNVEYNRLLVEYSSLLASMNGAEPLSRITDSLIGNPEHVIEVGEHILAASLIEFYLQYVYCSKFVDFKNIKVFVELGGGSGKQIELLKKLHPDICFIIFDIAPQLYVCEQYLKALFPKSLVSYRETRDWKKLKNPAGKILICGTNQFPLISDLRVDLFWNSASFQEMEPEVVENYLQFVKDCASQVYLREAMGGKEVTKEEGKLGVIRATTFENYKNGLENFQLLDMSPTIWPLTKRLVYSDSFWDKSR